jgi:hypothetical protein
VEIFANSVTHCCIKTLTLHPQAPHPSSSYIGKATRSSHTQNGSIHKESNQSTEQVLDIVRLDESARHNYSYTCKLFTGLNLLEKFDEELAIAGRSQVNEF